MVRPYLRWIGLYVGLIAVGIVVMSLDHSNIPITALGLAIMSVGAIGIVCLAFYAVGRSEDEERASSGGSAPSPPRTPPR